MTLLLVSNLSEARVKRLSLDMNPDVYLAHHDLRFEEKAFDKKWLEQEITCHFEEKSRCRNLAALLRMYVEAVPNPKKLKAYAYEIKDQLRHSDRNLAEIAMFLYLYCNDSSLIHVLDEYALEGIQKQPVENFLDPAEIIKRLSSDDEAAVAQTMIVLLKHPDNVKMSEQVFEQVVQVTINEALDRKTRYLAFNYLSDMGFYVYYGEDEQGKFSLGKITVHSGRRCLTEYLSGMPISKVWKIHAKNLTTNGLDNHHDWETDMVGFIKKLSFIRDTEAEQKLKFVLKTKAYKKAQPSLKFIVGDMLMFGHENLGLPIIKTAFKEGNNAMKSAIVAKFTEHFPVKKNYWDKLMKKSTAAEQVMIGRSKKQWDINMEKFEDVKSSKIND